MKTNSLLAFTFVYNHMVSRSRFKILIWIWSNQSGPKMRIQTSTAKKCKNISWPDYLRLPELHSQRIHWKEKKMTHNAQLDRGTSKIPMSISRDKHFCATFAFFNLRNTCAKNLSSSRCECIDFLWHVFRDGAIEHLCNQTNRSQLLLDNTASDVWRSHFWSKHLNSGVKFIIWAEFLWNGVVEWSYI